MTIIRDVNATLDAETTKVIGTVNISAGQAVTVTGGATAANQTAADTLTGAVNETAPANDTASSGLNGRLQRIAQRITSLITALGSPFQAGGSIGNTAFGVNNGAGASAVNVQDGGNSLTIDATALPLPTGASTEATLAEASAKLPATLGQKIAAASMAVTLASDKKVPVVVGDGANLDAFSRLRISNPTTIFTSDQKYGDNLLQWETALTGTGSITFLPDESCIQMSTGSTTSGASCVRSTRQYIRYQPGKSQLVLMTFVMNGTAGYSNARARVGYFDDNNGIFLQTTGASFANININLRTSTSGSAVTTSVAQASWNIDPLNGTGPSGLTLDLSKAQILVIDLQWLGVGRVRCGFDIGGEIVYFHQFLNANTTQTAVYMKWATLTPRLSVENTGTTAQAKTLKHICTTIISEGGDSFGGSTAFTHHNGITAIGVTTRRPVLSIRAKTTGPNSIRNIGLIVMSNLGLTASTNNALYEIVLNGTLTGASWSAVDSTYSFGEKDVSATAISGGIIIGSGYVLSGSGSIRGGTTTNFARDLALAYSALNSVQDTLSIVCTSFTGTSNILASVSWEELGL